MSEARLFFVTMVRAKRVAILLGPYADLWTASNNVERARKLAEEVDPFTHFDAFGVTSYLASDVSRCKVKSVFGA